MRRPGLVAMLLLAAACATAGAGRATSRGAPRVRLDHGISLDVAPRILSLPEVSAFRFVPPDSIAHGLTEEDATSVGAREPRELREALTTLLHGVDWELVPDSAEYDLAAFMTARTVRRTEQRTESYPDPNANLPRCGNTRADRPGVTCTNNPNPVRTVNVTVVDVQRRIMVVMRRRADGALHWWNYPLLDLEAVKASVARDLLRMRLTREE